MAPHSNHIPAYKEDVRVPGLRSPAVPRPINQKSGGFRWKSVAAASYGATKTKESTFQKASLFTIALLNDDSAAA
ncbi:hypothetical protein AAFF_G00187170 [Aldrovandia affinis]|uniref:Uncharacterized protein n=1 Tax=Aldrovandia affinis TaxID=143900 RepID=A0AAD7WVQ5_9TELE|nr:hypothetical protein AAFF_G00187170 [Aldrovandia affinis]